MNHFLIPANSKKSMMIFGLFYPFDLILFAIGIFTTILLVMVLPIADMIFAFIAILPAMITGLLVFPVPNYHNVLTVIIAAWSYIMKNQRFIWKGWCVIDEQNKTEKK